MGRKLRIFSNYCIAATALILMIIKAIINFKQQILTLRNTNFQKLDHILTTKNSRFKSKAVPEMIPYSLFDLVTTLIHNMQIST